MKISALEFSLAGDKYFGRKYEEMDCQAFVEKCMADVGLRMDLGGSNSCCRKKCCPRGRRSCFRRRRECGAYRKSTPKGAGMGSRVNSGLSVNYLL